MNLDLYWKGHGEGEERLLRREAVAMRWFLRGCLACVILGVIYYFAIRGDLHVSTVPEIPPEEQVYVVAPGDSLYVISRRFRVPVWELVQRNAIEDPDRIYPGQELVLR